MSTVNTRKNAHIRPIYIQIAFIALLMLSIAACGKSPTAVISDNEPENTATSTVTPTQPQSLSDGQSPPEAEQETPQPQETATPGSETSPVNIAKVEIENSLDLKPEDQVQVEPRAYDENGNEILGVIFTYTIDNNAGSVDDSGLITVGIVAGEYTGAIRVEATLGESTQTATADMVVLPGVLHSVSVTPETAETGIKGSASFVALSTDRHGNEIADASVIWAIQEEIGSIDSNGNFTALNMAGYFGGAINATVTVADEEVIGTSSVTVNPGVPAAVEIEEITVAAGDQINLQASVVDQYGNVIQDQELVWTIIDQNAGTISGKNELAAGEVAALYGNSVKVIAKESGFSISADITVLPGPLVQVNAAPEGIDLGMSMTQQFVAAGVDEFGNRIPDLYFSWNVVAEGGEVTSDGLFTAGIVPGSYLHTVEASTRVEGREYFVQMTVKVEADRLAFISDRVNGQFDYYLMGVDGSDVVSILETPIDESFYSWSPDGRRIVYEVDGFTYAINDDGTWLTEILGTEYFAANDFQVYATEPSWSPDGSKIAFIQTYVPLDALGLLDFDSANRDIYVMDVDGSNITRLTNTEQGDEWTPSWSPNGERIVYDFTLKGYAGDIWVMDADGKNQRRLTFDPANDTFPSFSPDGKKILFSSARSGISQVWVMNSNGVVQTQLTRGANPSYAPSWSPDGSQISFTTNVGDESDIFVADRVGNQSQNITNNKSNDLMGMWAPRKRGIETSEELVVFNNISNLPAQSIQEITANVKSALVRIETDAGSGSGFLIDPNGFIVTNNHVITDAKEVRVMLSDGVELAAAIVGRDLVRDIAILKISLTDLPYLGFGEFTSISLGSEVLVMGFPLGSFNVSVTRGLASSFLFDPGRNINWVQTDSAINPGNSGGPLLNLQGEVVGVVTSKRTNTAIEGVGFAVSSATIGLYLDRLLDGETVTQ